MDGLAGLRSMSGGEKKGRGEGKGLSSHVIVIPAGAEVPLGLGVGAVGGAIGPFLGGHGDQIPR